MITYYIVFSILAVIEFEVRCQDPLREYAASHDNYESYSFAYGVNDPKSGDHKHQWERMDNGRVQGEYGLVEPDGCMRLVTYTSGPGEGFHAKVTKIPMNAGPPVFSQGRPLYGDRRYDGSRYASTGTSGVGINQYQEEIPGNVQPAYDQRYYEQTARQDPIGYDYVNQESPRHILITRAAVNETVEQNRPNNNQSLRRKHVVKKNIESEAASAHTGLEYISNFNLNPVSVDQLNIPKNEKKILRGLATQIHPSRVLPASLHSPRPFALPNIQFHQANAPISHPGQQFNPALFHFQQHIGDYQTIPNGGRYTAPLIIEDTPQIVPQPQVPSSIQEVQAQQEVKPSYGEQRLEQALVSIHSHPDVKTRLEKIQTQYRLPLIQPIFSKQQSYEESPKILTGNHQQIRPQYIQNQQSYSQTLPQQIYQTNDGYNQQQQQRAPHRDRIHLKYQRKYPAILVDPEAKFGLPFYPSSKNINQIPQTEFNYEGIPEYSPSREGKRYTNENQTPERKAQERQYLLGEIPGPIFSPPPGYTRETIWQAGDPSADPEVEALVLQLNQTCAYIQWNETTPGNEDKKPNIWQGGDISAKLQEEELIRSANVTCENYTADALANFSSGYSIVDYCWQCVKNDGSFYVTDDNGNKIVPSYIPTNFGPHNEQQENHQQIQQEQENQQPPQQEQPQPEYIQNSHQQVLAGQIQGDYETSVEGYDRQQDADDTSLYQNSQGNYGRKTGPRKSTIYPNYGYQNDPQSSHYGLQRRRNINKQNRRSQNTPDKIKV